MRRNVILAAGLLARLIPAGTWAQQSRKTVTVEVYVPEDARRFIEDQVTLYLLPPWNARLLPQLQKRPPGARVNSVAHRMGDIQPDDQIVVNTELGEFDIDLWKAETFRAR